MSSRIVTRFVASATFKPTRQHGFGAAGATAVIRAPWHGPQLQVKDLRRYSSTMHENDPEVLEMEKKRNLSGTQRHTSTPHSDNAPGWNEHLASESEADIKADQSGGTIEELVAKTVNYVRSRHSPDDSLDSTTAGYAVDEVTGPLSDKGAKGKGDNNIDQEETLKTSKTTKTVHETKVHKSDGSA